MCNYKDEEITWWGNIVIIIINSSYPTTDLTSLYLNVETPFNKYPSITSVISYLEQCKFSFTTLAGFVNRQEASRNPTKKALFHHLALECMYIKLRSNPPSDIHHTSSLQSEWIQQISMILNYFDNIINEINHSD